MERNNSLLLFFYNIFFSFLTHIVCRVLIKATFNAFASTIQYCVIVTD